MTVAVCYCLRGLRDSLQLLYDALEFSDETTQAGRLFGRTFAEGVDQRRVVLKHGTLPALEPEPELLFEFPQVSQDCSCVVEFVGRGYQLDLVVALMMCFT